MSSTLHSILQAAKLSYLHQLRSGGYTCRHLVRTRNRLDHFLHWSEACDIYRADQLGHQLIYDYQNHFDYQLYCQRLTRRRAKASLDSTAIGGTTPSSCKRFATGCRGSTRKV
jgi:hypothetical protein